MGYYLTSTGDSLYRNSTLNFDIIDYVPRTEGVSVSNSYEEYTEYVTISGESKTVHSLHINIYTLTQFPGHQTNRNFINGGRQDISVAGSTPQYNFPLSDTYNLYLYSGDSAQVGGDGVISWIISKDITVPFTKTYIDLNKELASGIYTSKTALDGYMVLFKVVNLNGRQVLCFGHTAEVIGTGNAKYQTTLYGLYVDEINLFGDLTLEEEDPEYGEYGGEGGYIGGSGSFDDTSDHIGVPAMPSVSVSSIGFVNVYKVNEGSLTSFIEQIFPEPSPIDFPSEPTLDEVADCVVSVGKAIETAITNTNNAKLIDYILDTHVIPVSPTQLTQHNIKVGWKLTDITVQQTVTDYVDFDCGTLNISEYYNNFIDYVGTTAQIYLPFVGYMPLQPEYFQNGKLRVVYRFNVIDGSFVCWVLSTSSKSALTDSVIGTYSGNCCVHVPVTAVNYTNVISGMVNGVSNMMNSAVNKSPSGAVNGALQVLSAKPDLMMSNGYNATSSYCGIRYPYLIIKRQKAQFPKTYANENGIPINATYKLSELDGYSEIGNIILDGINADNDEKEELRKALAEGIIL